MCNEFMQYCYWKSLWTSFEASLSLRARAPEFVPGRQESVLCGPRLANVPKRSWSSNIDM